MRFDAPRVAEATRKSYDISKLDLRRAERVLWIRAVLDVSAGTVSLYREQFTENNKPKRRRLFYVIEEAYPALREKPRPSDLVA